MATLVIIGFLAGVVTGISPCVLPVLPVIFAGSTASGLDERTKRKVGVAADAAGQVGDSAADPVGERPDTTLGGEPSSPERATGHRRRKAPLVVIGLVVSFSVATLAGSSLLSLLNLPQDTLRWAGIVGIVVVGIGLMFPLFGMVLDRPFARLGRIRPRRGNGDLVLGLSLGLVFVPCAGPVLAAMSVVGATHRIGLAAVVLTVSFACGVAVPLGVLALIGDRFATSLPGLRSRAASVRRFSGAVLVVVAAVLATNLTDGLQQAVPGYTGRLQASIEGTATAREALSGVTGNGGGGALGSCTDASPILQRCGPAPSIVGISSWLNTADDRSVSLTSLRGRVVLVDFWTYSCINCQRTLPHLEAWERKYRALGLTIIGVHSPEFAFEHARDNVKAAAAQLGVSYPIALDNRFATWDSYDNQYWPAEYLIDSSGQVRHVDFGEGHYARTESLIRRLLADARPGIRLPPATDVPDETPTDPTTPESYLGSERDQTLDGQLVVPGVMSTYEPPDPVQPNQYAYAGRWLIGKESSTAGHGAAIDLQFEARDVYLVAGGTGQIRVSIAGQPTRVVVVGGVPRLYQVVGPGPSQQALVSLSFSPGLRAYDFTFG